MNRKCQQEIAGFVVIVVVVIMIGLIFFSFSIGSGESVETNSVEIENLLSASMGHISSCAINFYPQYLDMEELIKECYDNGRCLDDRDACEVLNEEYLDLIENSLDIGNERVNKGFELKILYKDLELDDEGYEIVPVFQKGEMEGCSSRVGASKSIDVGFGSGVIGVELRVCRG